MVMAAVEGMAVFYYFFEIFLSRVRLTRGEFFAECSIKNTWQKNSLPTEKSQVDFVVGGTR